MTKRQLTYLILAQLWLGHGDPVPRQLLANDPHGVHLADPESRHLEVHHDQVSLPRTGKQANCHDQKCYYEIIFRVSAPSADVRLSCSWGMVSPNRKSVIQLQIIHTILYSRLYRIQIT